VSQELEIPLSHGEPRSLRAIWDAGAAPRRASAILYAHGAELDLDSDFFEETAQGLAAQGFDVLRFRYPYMERRALTGKRYPPDRVERLEDAHGLALEFLRRRAPGSRILLAGKSMGARISTHLAAKGHDAAGLVLFGYPLQPASDPARVRSEHFATILQPTLFLQGTRGAEAVRRSGRTRRRRRRKPRHRGQQELRPFTERRAPRARASSRRVGVRGLR
jgi:predicted alpha/beta-hydrolase family hydrolase